jgi:hypothetical protein
LGYSCRSAASGCIREARRAGTNAAVIPTSAGSQTRLFIFGAQPQQPAGFQGTSAAFWQPAGGGGGRRGGSAPPRGGSLRVVTTNLKAGYLRRNGVPYSGNARLTEYYNRANEANGDAYLVVHAGRGPHLLEHALGDQHALQEGARQYALDAEPVRVIHAL